MPRLERVSMSSRHPLSFGSCPIVAVCLLLRISGKPFSSFSLGHHIRSCRKKTGLQGLAAPPDLPPVPSCRLEYNAWVRGKAKAMKHRRLAWYLLRRFQLALNLALPESGPLGGASCSPRFYHFFSWLNISFFRTRIRRRYA